MMHLVKNDTAVVIVYFTAEMTILLTLSVFQLMVNNLLPNKSGAIPLIGGYDMIKIQQHDKAIN